MAACIVALKVYDPRSGAEVVVKDTQVGGYRAVRARSGDMKDFSLTINAEPDDLGALSAIASGWIVESYVNGTLRHRGYVEAIDLTIGDPCVYTLSGAGIAVKVGRMDAPAKRIRSTDPLDLSDVFVAVVKDHVQATHPAVKVVGTTISSDAYEVDGTGKTIHQVMDQLTRGNGLNVAVSGGDVDPADGADRLYMRPADTYARYHIPVPSAKVTAARSRGLGRLGGIINVVEIVGGPSQYPNLVYNGSFERQGFTGTDAVADGWELAGGTVTAANWADDGAQDGAYCLTLTGTASDTVDGRITLRPAAGGSFRIRPNQSLLLRAYVKSASGAIPALTLRAETRTEDGARAALYETAVAAAGSGYGAWTAISVSFTAGANAQFVAPSLLVRGNATDLSIDSISLTDAAASTPYVRDGLFRSVLRVTDSALSAGLTLRAKNSIADNGPRLKTVFNDTVTTPAAARAVATNLFNAKAVDTPAPTITVEDDPTAYVPGDGIALVGSFGSALMGGDAFLPIAQLTMEWSAGGAWIQTLDLHTEEERPGEAQRRGDAESAARGDAAGMTTAPVAAGTRPDLPVPQTAGQGATPTAGGTGGVDGDQGRAHVFGVMFTTDPRGDVIEAGATSDDDVTASRAWTLTRWRLDMDAGTVTIALRKNGTRVSPADTHPSGGTGSRGANLVGWDTEIAEGDVVDFELIAVTGSPTWATLEVEAETPAT